MNDKVYIIVTAYNSADFLEECLDSLVNQSLRPTEILLGIDGCQKTLDKYNDVKHRYSSIVRAFFYPNNAGTYITKNSLLKYVPEDALVIFFDSDDVAYPEMILTMRELQPCHATYHSPVCFEKSLFKQLGGFMPWICAADREFFVRLNRLGALVGFNFKEIPFLSYRRVHDNQLTSRKDTGLGSPLRVGYHKLIDETRNGSNVYAYPVCHKDEVSL